MTGIEYSRTGDYIVSGESIQYTQAPEEEATLSWPASRAGVNNRGFVSGTSAEGVVSQEWTYNPGGGGFFSDGITTEALIDTTRVYTLVQDADDPPGNIITSLNKNDGSVVWTTTSSEIGREIAGDGKSGALGGGRIYVPGTSGGEGGGDEVVALSRTDGSVLWESSTGGDNTYNNVKHDNGVVYVTGDRIVALNASDGTVIWNSAPIVSTYSVSVPAIGSAVVTVQTDSISFPSERNLVAYSKSDGSQIWSRFPAGSPSPTQGRVGHATIAGGNVIWVYTTDIGEDKSIEAVDITDGSPIWETAFGTSGPKESLAVEPNAGVALVKGSGGNFYGVDISGGTNLWQTTITEEGITEGGPAASYNGTFVVRGSNKILAFDASNGDSIWTYTGASGASEVISADTTGLYIESAGVALLKMTG
jgi:outer membrane protein assembly factor BamB